MPVGPRMSGRILVSVIAATGLLAVPSAAAAHGIGGRSDLPVPLEFFLWGAGVVLGVSFGALAVLWPTARLQGGPRYRGRGWRPPRMLVAASAGGGIGALALVVAAGLFGDRAAPTNIAPSLIWVFFWLVLPFLAAVTGNVWSAVGPWNALGRTLGFDRGERGPDSRWGVWPAVVGFLAFVWLELVYTDSADPRVLGIAAVAYTAYLLAWMRQVGVDRTVSGVDAFGVYHRLISSIAPVGRSPDGRLRWRGWLRSLPVLPDWPGLAAFVIAMIGTVSYDGLSATPWWDDVTFSMVGTAQRDWWFGTIALIVIVGLVGGGYLSASWWASRIAGDPGSGALRVARSFAHTLIPIALAYAVAHYFTLVLFEGQLLISAASDPLGLGWNLFGTAEWTVNYTFLSPTAVWYVQVAVIVGGHVIGVVLAHDRALAVFPPDRAVKSQYAMLALMVALTGLGLTILAAG